MKTLNKTILVLMAIVAISMTSCKKDDDGGGGGGAASGTLKADVQGSGSFSSEPTISFATRVNANGINMISLNATDLNQRNINFTMNGVGETGTFAIGGGANISIVAGYIEIDINNQQNTQTWQAPFDDTEAGEIKISVLTDTNIQGTFSFKGKNVNGDQSTKEVSNGSFDLNFQ